MGLYFMGRFVTLNDSLCPIVLVNSSYIMLLLLTNFIKIRCDCKKLCNYSQYVPTVSHTYYIITSTYYSLYHLFVLQFHPHKMYVPA